MHRRINLPVIVTGNGSITSSHLPNGQALIRKQTNPVVLVHSGTDNLGTMTSQNNNNNLRLVNNNSLSSNNNNSKQQPQSQQAQNQQQQQQQQQQSQQQNQQQQQQQQLQQQIPLKAISWNYAVDVWWDKVMADASSECEPVWVDAEDPLFILYTR